MWCPAINHKLTSLSKPVHEQFIHPFHLFIDTLCTNKSILWTAWSSISRGSSLAICRTRFVSRTRDWWLKSPNEIRVRIGGFAIREICHSQHVTPLVSRIRSREWRASRSWFLTSEIVCDHGDWLTDNRLMGHESTVQHTNRIPRVPSDESQLMGGYCPACRPYLIATRFWVVVICPILKCLTVLEFSFILFDLCLFITIFNFILNYVPIVTFWIFTYHKIWILLIIFCFIWNYWIIYFLTCLEVFWSVVS